jgi:hypothetical protein
MSTASDNSSPAEHPVGKPTEPPRNALGLTKEEMADVIRQVAEMQRKGWLEDPDRHPETPDDEILSRLD